MSASGRHHRRLAIALALVAAFFVVEAVAALMTGSLALLSDAGHMLTDVVGLGMALAAVRLGLRGSERPHRSFGWYRAEILAALVNAVLLFGVAGYVLVVAAGRWADPPDLDPAPMLAVGALGLVVACASVLLLHRGQRDSLNLRGAYLEVLADALGSLGVVTAATVLWLTGWPYADPLFAAAIGVFIVPRAWRLGRESLRVLLQAAPAHLSPEQMRHDLALLEGVVDVHDVHAWTLTSGMEVVSAHVMVSAAADSHDVLDRASALLVERYDVEHATVQVEPEDHEGCERLTW